MSDCGKLKTRAKLVVDETLLDEEVDLLLSCCGCPDEDEIA